jgi:hypothetical protein
MAHQLNGPGYGREAHGKTDAYPRYEVVTVAAPSAPRIGSLI